MACSWSVALSASLFCVSCRPPAAGGFVPLLYIKGEANYMHAALFSYVEKHDVLCCRVGGRPGDPCSDLVIMA
jgi:hypothetical protein